MTIAGLLARRLSHAFVFLNGTPAIIAQVIIHVWIPLAQRTTVRLKVVLRHYALFRRDEGAGAGYALGTILGGASVCGHANPGYDPDQGKP